MTETRKQIIKLIEPYMNKELSEGCYIYQERNYKQGEKEFYIRIARSYKNIDELRKHIQSDTKFLKDLKILGHYDITAVFDYINSISTNGVGPVYFDNVVWEKDYWVFQKTDYTGNIKIPKKALHLFSEQEEKDLLKLLKELGQNIKN